MKILNAFSLNMIEAFPASFVVKEIPLEAAKEAAGKIESCVGHADTARIFSGLLGADVPFNRATVTLKKGEVALVGQYVGPRLPEGATALPEGATVKWLLVTIG